jgi:protease-4
VIILLVVSINPKTEFTASTKLMRSGGEDKIAFVRLNGEIVQMADDSFVGFNPFVITPYRTRNLVADLKKDNTIKAVVIKINSPGGSVVASEEIYQQFKSLSQDKTLIIDFGDVAASGGYYVATAADKIMASRASLTGSIGVIMFSPDFSGLYEKVGVDISTYKSGQFKDIGTPNRAATEKEAKILQSLVRDSYQLFLDRVAQEREIEPERLKQLADGRVFSGQQAYENGLIDEIGTVDDAIDLAAQEAGLTKPSVVEYTYGGGFFGGLIQSKMTTLLPSSQLDSLMPRKVGLYYLWE